MCAQGYMSWNRNMATFASNVGAEYRRRLVSRGMLEWAKTISAYEIEALVRTKRSEIRSCMGPKKRWPDCLPEGFDSGYKPSKARWRQPMTTTGKLRETS